MRVGATDSATGGAVTALQNFLVSQGYFSSFNVGTGRFGPLTYAALVRFQAAQGLPATGYAGPMTSTRIQALTCGTSTVPPANTLVSLYSVNPTSGAVGSTVSITGFGFTGDNTILFDGMVAARNVPLAPSIAIPCPSNSLCAGGMQQTITFSVPSALSPNCAPNMACALYVRLVTPRPPTVSLSKTATAPAIRSRSLLLRQIPHNRFRSPALMRRQRSRSGSRAPGLSTSRRGATTAIFITE